MSDETKILHVFAHLCRVLKRTDAEVSFSRAGVIATKGQAHLALRFPLFGGEKLLLIIHDRNSETEFYCRLRDACTVHPDRLELYCEEGNVFIKTRGKKVEVVIAGDNFRHEIEI